MPDTHPSSMPIEAQKFLQDHPDINTFEILLTDLNGVLRGKWLQRDNFEKVFKGEFKLPLTAVSPDIWGRDVSSLCAATGDGDGICDAVLNTLKPVPWLKRPTAQIFVQLNDDKGKPWGFDPRVVLQQVYQRYQALGLRPVTAPELEFYLFREERGPQGEPQLPSSRVNGNTHIGGQLYGADVMQENAELMHDIRDACKVLQLPLDCLLKELGPSQYELNLHHVDDPLLAADNAQLLKRTIKGVAQNHGYIASFMAKPFGHLDGSGMHVHASVLNTKGENIFDNGSPEGSEQLRHAIAGLEQTMADTQLIFAPHLNSYRRIQAGMLSPAAPTWGYENRYVSMRIPNGDCRARRIEYRLAGADANPYLVNAAILAGILYGIEGKLQPAAPRQLEDTEGETTLATCWPTAIEKFEQSRYVREYLGAGFHQAYCAVKKAEMTEFDRVVSPLEYDSYLVLA